MGSGWVLFLVPLWECGGGSAHSAIPSAESSVRKRRMRNAAERREVPGAALRGGGLCGLGLCRSSGTPPAALSAARPLCCAHCSARGWGGGTDGTQLPLSWGGFEWGPHGARAKAQQPSTTLFCVALSIQNDTPSTVQSGTARGVKISSGGGRAAGGDGDTAGGGGSARRSPHCRGGWGGGGRAWGCRAAVLGGAGCPHLVQSSVANACPRGRGGGGGGSVRSRGAALP